MATDDMTPEEAALRATIESLNCGGVTTLYNGQVISQVHDPSICADRDYGCALHIPSADNPLRNEPLRMRADLVLERLCPKHFVWHPDSDSVIFHWRVEGRDVAIHRCCPDECCEPQD